jgi:cytochrome c553
MKKTASLLALLAVAGLMMVTAPEPADARPQYLKAFTAKYDKVKDEIDKRKPLTAKCAVCHGKEGKDKKLLSDYGTELKKAVLALGKNNQRDPEKIDKAFDAAAEVQCEEGKTYGELLESGKLPPPHKDEK